jgi:riboflavin biosynthesis pyrimidine reductase
MNSAIDERRDVAGALSPIWEAPLPRGPVRGRGMPGELVQRYGGELLVPIRSDRPTILANFVTTLDGVVALGTGELSGGGPVSGFHEPDRFVMSLLRSLADVVLVGAGTVRASSDQRWIPAHRQARHAALFAAWRRAMELASHPTTVVVSASGNLPVDHPGLSDPDIPVVIATTRRGAAELRARSVAPHVVVRAVGDGGAPTGQALVELMADLGAEIVLTEGGPHLFGQLVGPDLLDELFLTLAPQLVGRGGRERLGLVEGVSLPPADGRWQELVSVRRSAQHLFLRYRRAGHRTHEET